MAFRSPPYSTRDSSHGPSGWRPGRGCTGGTLLSPGESSYRTASRAVPPPASTVKPPDGPVKIHRNCDFSPLHSSISMVRSNSAGSHSAKYLRGGPGTFHLVRGDGAPGNSKPSPPAEDPFQGGRSTLAGFAGSTRCCAASADAESTAPENMRRETFFMEPPAAFVSHARLRRTAYLRDCSFFPRHIGSGATIGQPNRQIWIPL